MKRIVVSLGLLALIAAGIIAFFMSAPQQTDERVAESGGSAEAPLTVVTTTGMLADAVRQIGGAHVAVQSLMGPGIDPHLYKASAGDVQKMTGADLIILNGLHLEGKMGEVVAEMRNRSIPSLAVGDAIDSSKLLSVSDAAKAHDPHIWFDVELWSEAIAIIKDALVQERPQHRAAFETAAAAYRKQLADLHQRVLKKANGLPAAQRVLVTAHDAFGYFARAYQFEVHGIQGVSTAAEAGAKDVQRLAELIATRKIRAIFVESSVPPRLVEALQAAVRDRGFDVAIGGELYGDAMGPAGTDADNYLGMVRHNIDTIVGALSDGDDAVARGDEQ